MKHFLSRLEVVRFLPPCRFNRWWTLYAFQVLHKLVPLHLCAHIVLHAQILSPHHPAGQQPSAVLPPTFGALPQKWSLPRPLKPDSKRFFKLAYSDSDSTGQTYSVLYSWFYNQLLLFKDAHFGFFPANTDNHLPLTVHTIRFLTFSLLVVYEHIEGRKCEDVGSKDGFKDS